MNRYLFTFCTLLCSIIVATTAPAQPAWQWGRSATGLHDTYPIAVDDSGNTYSIIDNVLDSFSVGSIHFPSTMYYNLVLVKYNTSGALLWAISLARGDFYTSVQDMTTDPAGNLIIVGQIGASILFTGGTSLVNHHAPQIAYFVAKINSSGSLLWSLSDGCLNAAGGILQRIARVAADDTGNIYVACNYEALTDSIGLYALPFYGSNINISLSKYTPSGTLLWATGIIDSSGTGDNAVSGITLVPGGNVYICGYSSCPFITIGTTTLTNTHPGTMQSLIASFTPGGTPAWAQMAASTQNNYAVAIQHDTTGNIYVAGNFNGDTMSLSSTLMSLPPALPTSGSVYVLKYSPGYTVEWGNAIYDQIPFSIYAWDLSVTASDEAWVCGSVAEGGPSIINAVLSACDTLAIPGTADPLFLAGYNAQGVALGGTVLPSGGEDQAAAATDKSGNVYVCGDYVSYSYTLGMAVGPDTLASGVPSGAIEQFFVAKFHNTPVAVIKSLANNACGSTSATLTGTPGAFSYLWDDGSTLANRTVTSPGAYWVHEILCADTVETDTFHVALGPAPPAITGPAGICANDTDILYYDTVGGGIWSFTGSSITSMNPATGAIYGSIPGADTIIYTAPDGCSVSKGIIIFGLCGDLVPVVVSNEALLIAPNPAAGELFVQAGSNGYNSITIINNLGQQMLHQTMSGMQATIDLSSLPPGVYYLRLTGADNTVVRSFVKR